jgi:hypothetical protein
MVEVSVRKDNVANLALLLGTDGHRETSRVDRNRIVYHETGKMLPR